jgi:anti-sigma-K factor RskA
LDIKDYISSGILEAYVLGSLSSSEAKEVESMSFEHPEVRKELRAIEDGLFHYAQKFSKEPPESLKSKILENFENGGKKEQKGVKGKTKEVKITQDKKPEKEAKVIPLSKKNNASVYMVAASITFALLCTFAALVFWKKWQRAEEKITALQSQNSVTTDIFNKTRFLLEEKIKMKSAHLTSVESELQMLLDTNMSSVYLKGMSLSPKSLALVFWKKDSKEVYIDVKSLPVPPAGMQYQLWALEKGKPVDAGVFEVMETLQFQKMKIITTAEAFAVTLEKKGGSLTPDMDAMYLMGNI